MINRIFGSRNSNLWNNKSEKEKFMALQRSMYASDLKELRNRIKEGISVNTLEPYFGGNILTFFAANQKKLKLKPEKVIAELINKGININHQCNKRSNNVSALHLSVISKDFPTTKELINYGADVHLKDMNGNTPLWKAVMSYRGEDEMLKIIKLLIDKGSNIDEENNYGNSPRKIILEHHEAVSPGGAMENHPKAKSWDLIQILKE